MGLDGIPRPGTRSEERVPGATGPRRNVLVVGMARSGTSLVASIFGAAGYYLGQRLRQADDANPLGYYQSEELTTLDAELLHRVGFPFHNTWIRGDIPEDAVAAIEKLEVLPEHRAFVARFDQHSPWAWKDPRLCATLGFWLKAIDLDRVCAVLVRRDPAGIYHSFRARNWITPENPLSRREVYRRIDRHIGWAHDALTRFSIPYAEIWYEDLLRTPHEVIQRINRVAEARLTLEHVNTRPDLDHSRVAARLWWYALQAVVRIRPVRRLAKAVIPAALVRRVFPERKYLRRPTDDSP